MSYDDEGNVSNELVGVPVDGTIVNVHPEILKDWKERIYEQLRKQDGVKGELKNIAEDIKDGSGIKGSVIIKWAKAKYKNETKKAKDLANTFEVLDGVVPSEAL